jgi:spermidine/putrescine transport system ATP-binding protein
MTTDKPGAPKGAPTHQKTGDDGATPAVDLSGITKRFVDMVAVDSIDLAIREGEFFTLLGASGCGKTTTLRLIAGFELPTEGQIRIGGQDVSDEPAYRRPVHTVFQSYALFPHLSVLENVAFPLRIRRLPGAERRRLALSALELVQMAGLQDRRPSQLSGGQQQRVALARALVNEPKVLLLDEPLGALDLKLRKEMQIELKHMQKRLGITFVFVTHDQEEALAMSDRVALMHNGRIVQIGDPASLYNAPANRYAATFIGETNILSAEVEGVSDDGLRLRCLGREVILPSPEGEPAFGPGQTVDLAIRPERIVRSPSPQEEIDGGIVLDGVLREAVFIGTDVRLIYEVASGETLICRIQNRTVAPPETGESTRLLLPGAALRCLTS